MSIIFKDENIFQILEDLKKKANKKSLILWKKIFLVSLISVILSLTILFILLVKGPPPYKETVSILVTDQNDNYFSVLSQLKVSCDVNEFLLYFNLRSYENVRYFYEYKCIKYDFARIMNKRGINFPDMNYNSTNPNFFLNNSISSFILNTKNQTNKNLSILDSKSLKNSQNNSENLTLYEDANINSEEIHSNLTENNSTIEISSPKNNLTDFFNLTQSNETIVISNQIYDLLNKNNSSGNILNNSTKIDTIEKLLSLESFWYQSKTVNLENSFTENINYLNDVELICDANFALAEFYLVYEKDKNKFYYNYRCYGSRKKDLLFKCKKKNSNKLFGGYTLDYITNLRLEVNENFQFINSFKLVNELIPNFIYYYEFTSCAIDVENM